MQKKIVEIEERKIVGLKIRTSYKEELNHKTSNISMLVRQYINSEIARILPNRKNPGIMITLYTEYESDYKGEYTYFIGEEVTEIGPLPKELTSTTIPAGNYAKFTTEPGELPDVLIKAWQEIWKMSEADLGGKRTYRTDFEVCNARAQDPQNTVLDIFVGIE